MRKILLMATCLSIGFVSTHSSNAQVVYLNKNQGGNSSGGITINNRSVNTNQSMYSQSQIGVDNTATPTISVSPSNSNINPQNIGDGGSIPIQKNGMLPAEEFGRDMPMELAISSIVPGNWHVNLKGVDTAKKVSWSGGRHWKDVLWTMVEANGYNVSYGKNNTITISGDYQGGSVKSTPLTATVTPTSNTPQSDMNGLRTQNSTTFNAQDLSNTNRNVVTPNDSPIGVTRQAIIKAKYSGKNDGNLLIPNKQAGNIVNSPNVTYAPQGGGVGIYYAAKGSQLDQVLQIWANANGWRVQYDAKMFYPIEMPLTLNDGFKESVKTLMRAIQDGSNPKPNYRFYLGNKVLRIFDYNDN